MKRITTTIVIIILAAITFFLIKNTGADLSGRIIKIDQENRRVHVEENDKSETWVTITDETKILNRTHKPKSFNDLEIGQKISVWIDRKHVVITTQPRIIVAKKIIKMDDS